MAKLLKLRRGTTSQHGSFTGAEGEVTVDLNKDVLVVHDGSTQGGHPVAAEDMANVSSTSIVSAIGASALAGAKVQPNFGSQNVETTGTLASGNHTVTGNIVVSGTVDGADIAAMNTKLSGIDTGAKDDQTAAEIRVLVEAATDSNVFTDADHIKLDNIATGATNVTNNNQIGNGAGYVTSSGNTIIGTDSDIDTSGASVIDQLNMTDGVITSHSTRTMTLADLGFTGATNANYITNNNEITNGAGYTTYTSNQATDTTSNVTFGTVNCSSLTSSGNVTAFSDKRLKENIEVIPNALDKVQAINGVSFDWKKTGERSAGVIAQEIQEVLPEAVKEVTPIGGGDSHLAVNYHALTSILIESIKELKARVQQLEGGK